MLVCAIVLSMMSAAAAVCCLPVRGDEVAFPWLCVPIAQRCMIPQLKIIFRRVIHLYWRTVLYSTPSTKCS